jgi:hypothetical protein
VALGRLEETATVSPAAAVAGDAGPELTHPFLADLPAEVRIGPPDDLAVVLRHP